MFDAMLAPMAARLLTPAARLLTRFGAKADHVTLVGFAIGVLAVPLLAAGLYGWALAMILLNRLCDGLDGAMARLDGPTNRGAFLDIALDFAFYALVVLGFALADPARNALAGAVLLTAFIGTGSSFLAFSVIAERTGQRTDAFPMKGIAYLGGLTEGAETITLFVLICLFPSAFPVLAVIFAALCALTTVMRWREGFRRFSPGQGA